MLYGGMVSAARTLLHKTLVGDEYGNVNAQANVAAAPSAGEALALANQGGVVGEGWRAGLQHCRGKAGAATAVAAASSGGERAAVAAVASGAGGP